ncbi:bifunctional [glutamate--ammonia ligase]-adenylyl-L-tyrosine phosphorylase/[glutamate--ammonia-ligase] adenylyltransferase [Pelagibaculum spongiae]|uniref:Bifunctional glutamine synthetase adenylyltransferase/adenylyl-removing enzyme n=2 Tax=Pelagibaculum spongiae TaxID=2080658 RepID=A0A2V1GUR5_9GAMM|nr:bifunctional [glutamate--ammonia ligase]-adenylyl-L-tyrosine phosphorylase/[glutamate--ammonia-ligase] adenylyltransferase [Pelagibaculum spongiae]
MTLQQNQTQQQNKSQTHRTLLSEKALPAELQQQAEQSWQRLQEQHSAFVLSEQLPESLHEPLLKLLALSDFALETLLKHPQLLEQLQQSGELTDSPSPEVMAQQMQQLLAEVNNEAELMKALRQYRTRHMLAIIWRDLLADSPLNQVCFDLSTMARICVDQALQLLYQWHCRDWGTPIGEESGLPQQMVVLGMGKLGAAELNLSSDIDLIFSWPEPGMTQGGRRQLANEQFFTRLGQALIRSINTHNADGFVFRVDMRLRPYGDSGALAMSFPAMETYYQEQGRDWERYAMIKAQPISGQAEDRAELMALLKPFVFRRYVDFSAIEALRDMKQLISREQRRRGMTDNIKLGPGGIREIEFVGQAWQLIRGGKEPDLQEPRLRKILAMLADKQIMPTDAIDQLDSGYEFLRRVEHRIQAIADKQTQQLPDNEKDQARIAYAMGFDNWPEFRQRLEQITSQVHLHFNDVIGTPEPAQKEAADLELRLLWQEDTDAENAVPLMEQLCIQQPAEVWQQLLALKESRGCRYMGKRGRERMKQLIPMLLAELGHQKQGKETAGRVFRVLEAISCRTAYIELLVENPQALVHLVSLCNNSLWITEQLARFPMLLDELLDTRNLYALKDRKTLSDDLRQSLLRVPEDDQERQLDALRQFKLAHVLQVAAADVTGHLPIMKVSDRLTDIAEVVLESVLEQSVTHLSQRHGLPQKADGSYGVEFTVIGYGKVGGWELGYSSDLDLVFVSDDFAGVTNGDKPVDNQVFYTRLGQRMIHLMNTRSALGELYEVDMRLRPSGNSGLLVASLEGFETYQFNDAWTWEHQSLTRARPVAGSIELARRFEVVRQKVLSQTREPKVLRETVCEMREKMRKALGSKPSLADAKAASQFHLKQDPGGIADIEFMVQYWVLCWSNQHPQLMRWTDNIRILETLAQQQLLPEQTCEALSNAYCAFRARGHRLSLQNQPARAAADEFTQQRALVAELWTNVMINGVVIK